MTAYDRERVKELFEAARSVVPAGREAFWIHQDTAPELRAEVDSLLEVYDTSPEFLETAELRLSDVAEAPAPGPELGGCRIGPWRLVREVGRGGMGVVWEALRDDREYEARVAIKLLAAAQFSQAGTARFREERQILARLDHPNIARLIDAGTSAQGYPYLVMDFVEGEPLDQWCERRNPGIRERLNLFAAVCDAVEYAHRHLVIHRDLKPANILVTEDGVPKLLDFGIAKLADAGPEESSGGVRALTPEFASPEQVRGDVATTASDIYSLGVLLYKLLTGRSPYGDHRSSPFDVIRAVCEENPQAPSQSEGPFVRQLRGALDSIVLCAMRKNPDHRYRSVAALAWDVRCWTEDRPVAAHVDSPWNRAWKFVRRNRAASAAAAVAVVSLIAGSAVSWWEAGVAQRERHRAEARFKQVRQFSRSLLFELNDAIRNLPGATPARTLLLARATQFLDGLAQDPATDTSLKLELAEGYRRLGHVQGSSFSDNIGRPDDAIVSFRKAARLGEQALAETQEKGPTLILLMGAYDDLTDALTGKGEPAEAEKFSRLHRALVERAEASPHSDLHLRLSVATSYSNLGYYRSQRNDLTGAKDLYGRAVAVFSELEQRNAGTAEGRTQYAFALKRLGAIRITEDALDDAERLYRTALDLETAAVSVNPGNIRLRVDRTLTLSDLGLLAKRRKDLPGAAAIYEEVVRVRREALDADPRNSRYRMVTMNAMVYLASTYSAAVRHREAVAVAREAVRLGDGIGGNSAYRERWQVARSQVALANILTDAGIATGGSGGEKFAREAEANLRLAAGFIDQMGERNSSPSDRGLRADYQTTRGQLKELVKKGKMLAR